MCFLSLSDMTVTLSLLRQFLIPPLKACSAFWPKGHFSTLKKNKEMEKKRGNGDWYCYPGLRLCCRCSEWISVIEAWPLFHLIPFPQEAHFSSWALVWNFLLQFFVSISNHNNIPVCPAAFNLTYKDGRWPKHVLPFCTSDITSCGSLYNKVT